MDIDFKEVLSLGNIEFLAKQVVEGFITGLHKSPYHGFSVEFAEHRQYNTGESTRFIDWKLFNRTDKLFVKTFDEETNLRCKILVDVSGSMYYPQENYGKLVFSILGASSMAYMLQKQRDAVGISIFSDKILYNSLIKSTAIHLNELFNTLKKYLQNPVQNQETNFVNVIHQIAEETPRRSLIVIFTDLLDCFDKKEALFNALKHLKHNKHEILLFHVAHHSTELDFKFAEKPYWFEDLETGQRIKLNPSQIKESYQKELSQFLAEIKWKCGQYKIDFIEANIEQDFKHILIPFLQMRKKMV